MWLQFDWWLTLLRAFLVSLREIFSRSLLFVWMNALFFGSILIGALLAQGHYLPFYVVWMDESIFPTEFGDPLFMVVYIFLFNIVLSAFLLVTLTGLLFFAFPVVVLVDRAASWGFLFNLLPTPLFFVAFLTIILEGMGYVLASVAGINLGLSWLKPDWAFRGEGFSRKKAFGKAFEECIYIYVLVSIFLLAAAIVETATIVYLG